MQAWLRVNEPEGVSIIPVESAIRSILQKTSLLTMSSTDEMGKPHINNAFFFASNFCLGFLSFRNTIHIQNIMQSPKAAISIASSEQIWGSSIKGLQLDGRVRPVEPSDREAFFAEYSHKFPLSESYCRELINSRDSESAQPFYFKTHEFKLIDEIIFGDEVYIQGSVLYEDHGK